jgi:glycosyltransferase involved in cell wall biosynthesis
MPPANNVRVAIVTPWYGAELLGGAERQAWDLAHALARNGAEVDVLTTCSRSFFDDWAANFHRSGSARDAAGVTVRRFAVDSRDRVAFNRVNTVLTTLPRAVLRGDRAVLDAASARTYVEQNITSRALLAYLGANATAYDAFLFLPYLHGTTLTGVPLVAARAFLVPCLHDEAYAYLEPVRTVFAAARGVLFNSAGEAETAAAIYGPGVLAKSGVTGEAVDPPAVPAQPSAIGGFAPHRARYVLYLGRQDRSKNVDFLIDAFRAFRERRVATSLQLVLAGPRAAAHSGDGVLDLGAVSEPAKAALLGYARALAQPSTNESFSRAMYEAWHAGRPVLVHGDCRATARAVEDSGGGWIGTTREDWVAMFATVDESSDDVVAAAGRRGQAAARNNGTWDDVARRTLDAIRTHLATPRGAVENVVPLAERGAVRRAAPRVVTPAVWDGVRPAHERWSDGKDVLLAIGPCDPDAARRLLETFVAYLAARRGARFLVFAGACDAAATATLLRERDELDLSADVELVGDALPERYAAYRAATVAFALGGPPAIEHAVMPLWFDVPLVALRGADVEQTIERCGVLVEAFDARRIATLLRLVATDASLRTAMIAEGRRVRARHAPPAPGPAVRSDSGGPAAQDELRRPF